MEVVMNKGPAKLKDIEVDEVSLVDKAANRRKFLIIKQDQQVEIAISTDGSAEGTEVMIDGEEIDGLEGFWFGYSDNDEWSDVSCSYTRIVDGDDAFGRSETYYLKKREVNEMELLKLLKSIDINPDDVDESLAPNLTAVAEMFDVMPPELQKAQIEIIKSAMVKDDPPAEEEPPGEDEEDPAASQEDEEDPPADQPSEEEVDATLTAMRALNARLPEDKQVVIKEDEPPAPEVATIVNSVNALLKPMIDTLSDGLKDIGNRLTVVEKATGVPQKEDDDPPDTPKKPLTKEEKLAKYGTLYPRAMGLVEE
jgi:hypothetical protein